MNQFDLLIKTEVAKHFPALLRAFGPEGWLWIKAQIKQESGFNPKAKSTAGAMGLMQLMPATDNWIDGDLDGFEPVGNVDNGVRHMAWLWSRFGEIPDPEERMRITLASYNGGRGYPNVALALARQAEDLPYGFSAWERSGRPGGRWQEWSFWGLFLPDPRCRVCVKGRWRRPYYRQIRDYVTKICAYHASYVNQEDV